MGKLLTADDGEDYISLVIYGKSGAGKTTMGVTAPKPLILLSERQGYRSVRDAARERGIAVPPTIFIESRDELRNVVKVLSGASDEPIAEVMRELFGRNKPEVEEQIASLPYLKPLTIVCDSMTDMFVLVSWDILQAQGNPKSDKDNLEVKNERYWGALGDRCEGLLRTMRDLPYHKVFLATLDDREVGEEDQKTRVVAPETIMRKLPAKMVQASNACGLAFVEQIAVKNKDTGESHYELHRRVRFAGPSWMLLKAIRPLGDVESDPDISKWIERIQGQDTNASVDVRSEAAASAKEHAATHPAGDAPPADAPADGTPVPETKPATAPAAAGSRRRRCGARRRAGHPRSSDRTCS